MGTPGCLWQGHLSNATGQTIPTDPERKQLLIDCKFIVPKVQYDQVPQWDLGCRNWLAMCEHHRCYWQDNGRCWHWSLGWRDCLVLVLIERWGWWRPGLGSNPIPGRPSIEKHCLNPSKLRGHIRGKRCCVALNFVHSNPCDLNNN